MTTLNSTLQLALLKRKKARNKLEKGFTLIELLIVVVILGILSSIALPAFLNQQDKAVANAMNSTAMSAAKSCAALLITGEEGQFKPPVYKDGTVGNASGGTDAKCTNGVDVEFFVTDNDGRAADAVATVGSDGSVELTVTSAPS